MKPLANQPAIVRASFDGRLTKKGSTRRVRAASSQPTTIAVKSTTRAAMSRARSAPGRLRVALLDFIPKVLPYLLVEPGELLTEPDLDDVARADEGDRVGGLDPARARREDDDLVGERDGLLEVVSDEEHGIARVRPQVQQLVLHQVARLDVERAEGLVHEKDGRPVDQRGGEGDALAHPARELVRVVVLEAGQPDAPHPLGGARAGLGGRRPANRERQGDVLERRLPRQERVALE